MHGLGIVIAKSILHLNNEAELQALLAQMKSKAPANKVDGGVYLTENVSTNKFNAIMTELDGIKFQSKKEARYYSELKARVHLGEVKFFLRQVPFYLPGGVTYRCDFMEVWTNGDIRFIDVKGYKTQVYINKKKTVEALYPIKIIEV